MHAARSHRTFFNHELFSYVEAPFRLGKLGEPGFGCRGLLFSQPGDVVQITAKLKPSWPWILEHLHSAGLSVASEILWDNRLDAIRDFGTWEISVYFWGEEINRLFPDPARAAMVQRLNDKNQFFAWAAELQAPLPATWSFGPDDFTPEDLNQASFPCLFKPAVSAQGMGIEFCPSPDAAMATSHRTGQTCGFQLQEILPDSTQFLNLLYDCPAEGPRRIVATEQILEGFGHSGNRHPVNGTEPWECTERLAHAAWQAGFRGPIGFDVASFCVGGRPHLAVIDCNPRFNGASYPAHVAERLGLRHWSSRGYPFSGTRVEEADHRLRGLCYSPNDRAGVIVINWGWIDQGEIGLLCTAPDQAQLIELEAKVHARFHHSIPSSSVSLAG